MNCYDFWSAIGTWAGAIATFLAVVVALFKGKIHKWLFPMQVQLEWQDCAPYMQASPARTGMSRPEEVMFRLKLTNYGKAEAKDVHVMIETLERVQPQRGNWVDDQLPWQPSPGFVPASLKWTHLNQPTLDFLPMESSRYLDFGRWEWYQTSPHPTLQLSTECEPGMNGSKLCAGKYRCQLIITERGGVLYRAWWSFEFEDANPPPNDHGAFGFCLKLDKLLIGGPQPNTLSKAESANCR